MTTGQAKELLHSMMQSPNLRKHCYAVAAIMKTLARHFHEDEELYEVAGLLHDADYEMYKDDAKKHPSAIFGEMEKRHVDPRIVAAVRSHAWGWREDLPEPKTIMEWSLYCCDELSGLITACALVRPDRKLASVTVDSVLKKFPQKSFAAGATRENIMYCQPKLGIKLEDFIALSLSAMQGISDQLGL